MPKASLYSKDDDITISTKTEEQPIDNKDLLENIKNIFTENKKIERDEIYFTVSKGKFEFNLDNSIFIPSKLTLLQVKKFEEKYLKQLESYIFTSKEEIDTDKLLPIIYLFSHLNKNNYPIRIVTSNYNKLLPKVCNILNKFFNKNYNVISSIYTMFNSIKDSEEEGKINE